MGDILFNKINEILCLIILLKKLFKKLKISLPKNETKSRYFCKLFIFYFQFKISPYELFLTIIHLEPNIFLFLSKLDEFMDNIRIIDNNVGIN